MTEATPRPDELAEATSSARPPLAETFRRGVRLFVAPPGQPRARRATDVVLLVPALVGLVLFVLAYPPSSFERSLQRLLATIPGWLDPVWEFFADLPWLWAVLLILAAIARRRWLVVGQALVAVVLGGLLAVVAARLAIGSWPDIAGSIFGTSSAPRFPSVRLAEAAAVMLTVAPHLVRPMRVLDRWILGLGVVGVAAAGGATPSGTIAALFVGAAAAAGVRLVVGTSLGRPGIRDIAAGLADIGVVAHGLEISERQVAGVFHVRGRDEEGRELLVKIYGRDAYDTQFVAKLWRSIWYRGSGVPISTGRLQSAEHEAFVTLLARRAGVASRDVVTAAATPDDDAVLVLRGEARALASLPPDELDDALLGAAWRALETLERARIAHRHLDPYTVVATPDEVGFVDFADATVAPDADARTADRAQLFATTAAVAGSARSIAAARGVLGDDGVADLLPYLQSAALGPELRRALKASGVDVDDLRVEAAAALDVEPPELVKLRRVSWRAAAQIALLGLASYAILSAAGGVDWDEFRTTLDHASWSWIAFAFVVAQLPRATQALSTLGSVPAPLPYGPVYGLQLATSYMNVALPSNLARMAVNIRFFQRQGLSAPTAVASGAIDSFASTVVQAALLGALLVFSESSLELSLPFPSGGSRTLLFVLAALVLVAIVALLVVRRVRRVIVENVRSWWPDVKTALGGLRRSHKLALLVLGSLATEVLFAAALGLFCRSLGYDISIAELLVINMSVSLLGSFVPVPGNIGVAEFGLAIGLTSAGMTDEAALAAVLLYRISTFYLPPLWGFFALHWLQRRRFL